MFVQCYKQNSLISKPTSIFIVVLCVTSCIDFQFYFVSALEFEFKIQTLQNLSLLTKHVFVASVHAYVNIFFKD